MHACVRAHARARVSTPRVILLSISCRNNYSDKENAKFSFCSQSPLRLWYNNLTGTAQSFSNCLAETGKTRNVKLTAASPYVHNHSSGRFFLWSSLGQCHDRDIPFGLVTPHPPSTPFSLVARWWAKCLVLWTRSHECAACLLHRNRSSGDCFRPGKPL